MANGVIIPNVNPIKELTVETTTNAAGNAEIRAAMGSRAYLDTVILGIIIDSPLSGLKAEPVLYVSGGNRYIGVHLEDLNGSPYSGAATLRVFFMDV